MHKRSDVLIDIEFFFQKGEECFFTRFRFLREPRENFLFPLKEKGYGGFTCHCLIRTLIGNLLHFNHFDFSGPIFVKDFEYF